MGRSGYNDDLSDEDPLALGRWRAAVRSAIKGKRGQAFLREALAALDALHNKELIVGDLVVDGMQCAYGDADIIVGADELCDGRGNVRHIGSCCLLGAVALARKMDVSGLDPEDIESVAPRFNLADAMTREIVYWNDEGGAHDETPKARWTRMRAWVESKIIKGSGDVVFQPHQR